MHATFLNVNMKLSQPQQLGSLLALLWVLWHNISICVGHGRLIEPPSRASAWRYGFQTPPDYNDHELYCGGFTRQWRKNDGKCGECGDPWDVPEPRPHEHGGLWGVGVIVRRYDPGAEITIRIELTASHMGYFEFRICENASAKQSCLDKHLLPILSGSPAIPSPTDLDTRFYPRNGSRIYEMKAQLPDLKCNHCVLQWRYIAGNNWGMCPNGNGAVGCGPQEEFRSCADIAITDELPTPMRPLRPTVRTTQRPTTTIASTSTSTEATLTDQTITFNYDYTSLFIGIVLVILFIIICYGIYYLHQKKNQRLKMLNAWIIQNFNNRFCKKQKPSNSNANANININTNAIAIGKTVPISHTQTSIVENIDKTLNLNGMVSAFNKLPIAPPRAKRLTRVRDLHSDESSVA